MKTHCSYELVSRMRKPLGFDRSCDPPPMVDYFDTYQLLITLLSRGTLERLEWYLSLYGERVGDLWRDRGRYGLTVIARGCSRYRWQANAVVLRLLYLFGCEKLLENRRGRRTGASRC